MATSFTELPYKQAETVQLAPDALVFINGSDTIKDDNGNVYEIRNDITDVSTSLSIDSTPGTASFTISLPDHSIRRFSDRRYKSLKLMSEIEIYFKGRFPIEGNDPIEYPYYPNFWGVIISIVENYSDGIHTISVSCADILRWWQITTVNINPAAVNQTDQAVEKQLNTTTNNPDKIIKGETTEDTIGEDGGVVNEPDLRENIKLSPFQTKFAQLNIGEILVELSKIATDELMPLRQSFEAAYGTSDKIDPVTAEQLEKDLADVMEYWRQRFIQIGRSIRIFGVNPETVRSDQNDRFRFDFDQENFLEVKPYLLETSPPPVYESELKPKIDIINELAESIQFEFYMDVTGEIIFKPPFYNMDVKNNMPSVIEDLDIISWTWNHTEAEIVTRVDVTGQWVDQISGRDADRSVRGVYVDFEKARLYGFRAQSRNFNWLNEKEQCLQYAAGELDRLNALARQGSLTIIGRPELRLGYPIYIPSRDAYYYIRGIDHSFSFGGTFNTTLTLVAERRKKYDENGNLIKWGIIRNIGEVDDNNITIEGNSIAEDTDYNNFVKQLIQPCFPNTGVQVLNVNEPNYADNLDFLSSSKFGTWEIQQNIKLNNPDITIEKQVTDKDGYEIIGAFKYGRDFEFTNISEIGQKQTSQTIVNQEDRKAVQSNEDRQANLKEQARKAQTLNAKTQDFVLAINPNNIALTLDNEDASMLSIFSKERKSKATMAQNVNPVRSDHSINTNTNQNTSLV